MNFLKKLSLAVKTLAAVCELAKRTDAAVSDRFSDLWWANLRKVTENWLYDVSRRTDKGILAMIQSDDQIVRGGMIFLKSDHLADVDRTKTKGITERQYAVVAMRKKDPAETVLKMTKMSGYHQP